MVTSTSSLKWFFVCALLCGFCAPDPLDDLNININIEEKEQEGSKGTNVKEHPINPPGTNDKEHTIYPIETPRELSCPTLGLNFGDRRDEEVLKNVASASLCSRRCRAKTNCNFWIWASKKAGGWALNCVLMSAYGNTYLDKHVVSGARKCNPTELSCPSDNTNTRERRDEEVLKNIESAFECSLNCREKTTCNFWTWAHKNAGQFALNCVLMSGFGYKVKDKNVISGAKTCQPREFSCPTLGLNFGDRRDEEVLKNVASASLCSRRCRAKTNCNFWVWASKKAGRWALNCALMSAYGNTYPDKHVVSGARKCNPTELSCPSDNTNTRERRDEEVLRNIESYEECSKRCHEKTKCNFWTWADRNAGQFALNCVLMSGFGYKVKDKNVISGAKTCQPRELSCPTLLLNFGDRRDEEVLKNVASASLCSRRCRAKTNCNFWVWASKKAGGWALNCVLMSAYGKTYPDKHVVSGARKCNPTELSCPSISTNTRERRDEEVLKHIESAFECSIKCRRKKTCYFWTWADRNAGQYALNCALMSGFGYKVKDKNVISGANRCNPKNCFEFNYRYVGEPLNKPGGDNNYGPTGSAVACQRLCQNTHGCAWFNWVGSNRQCWLKKGKGNGSQHRRGTTTGPKFCETGKSSRLYIGGTPPIPGRPPMIIGGTPPIPGRPPMFTDYEENMADITDAPEPELELVKTNTTNMI